jgi:hypothetical protein
VKFYARQKKYKYGTYPVYFWKYRAEDGRWVHGGSVYWGNRETEAITRYYEGIKRIAELSDGVERRHLIRTTPWLHRGAEDYSDRHFSQSIYLRMKELKKHTPELPKEEYGLHSHRHQAALRRETICKKIGELREELRERLARVDRKTIKMANDARILGRKLQLITGHTPLSKGQYIQIQGRLPDGITYEFCELALSIWRTTPKPIKSPDLAIEICVRLAKTLQ